MVKRGVEKRAGVKSFDQLMQGLSLVALLLYLTPLVSRFGISEKGKQRFFHAGLIVIAAGIILASGATILWFFK